MTGHLGFCFLLYLDPLLAHYHYYWTFLWQFNAIWYCCLHHHKLTDNKKKKNIKGQKQKPFFVHIWKSHLNILCFHIVSLTVFPLFSMFTTAAANHKKEKKAEEKLELLVYYIK